MRRIAVMCFCLVVCGSLFAQEPARAEDGKKAPQSEQDVPIKKAVEQTVDVLPEIVVVASRREVDIHYTPATVERIDQGEIRRRLAAPTLPDALREVPGVHIQKTGNGLGSPFIRGLTGFHTVLMVDGIRLNTSVFRTGPNQYWNTVDQLGIDRVELVQGPTSVLYGSDAIGGTLAVFTEALDYGVADEGWTVGGRAYYRYSTAEDSHVARLGFHAGYDGRFAASIGFTYRNVGDLDAGGGLGRQPATDYTADALDFKAGFVADPDVRIELLVQSVNLNNVPRTHKTTSSVGFHGTTHGSDKRRDFDQDRDMVLLSAFIDHGPFFDSAELRFAWQEQEEVQDRIRSDGRREFSGFDVNTLAIATQFESETGIGHFVYGADLYVDWVDSFKRRFTPSTGTTTIFAQGPVADDASYLTLGVFAEDTIDVGALGELTLGARFTHVMVDAGTVSDPSTGNTFSLEDDFQALVGGVHLLTPVTDEVNLFGGVGLGFRAPNLSDLTRFDSARSNEVEIPAPGLDPELFLGAEFGVKARTETFEGEATYFYTELFDTIIRTPTGAIIDGDEAVTKKNVGDGHIQGVEVAARWNFWDDLEAFGNFSWLDGVVDAFPTSAPVVKREPISRLTPMQGHVGLSWEPKDTGFRAEASVDLVASQHRLSTRDRRDSDRIPPGGTPGYVLFNVRFSYEFLEEKFVFLNFENIGDRNYRTHGSGQQEAGFNAILGFDLSF